MSLVYKLHTPVNMGSFAKSITVSSLKITSISVNFEDAYTNKGVAVLSICLVDTVTGYPINVVYKDESALSLAQSIDGQFAQTLFAKMAADGKIPAGTIS